VQRINGLIRHPMAGPTVRYGIAGCAVAAVYLGVPVLLNGMFGVAIQIAIPIAYLLAISLHFNLQRRFVFRHVATFALSGRKQAARYVVVAAIQYPTTALCTAVLPGVLGLSERTTYLGTAIAISVTFYLVLRSHVFHATDEPQPPVI